MTFMENADTPIDNADKVQFDPFRGPIFTKNWPSRMGIQLRNKNKGQKGEFNGTNPQMLIVILGLLWILIINQRRKEFVRNSIFIEHMHIIRIHLNNR